MWRIIHVWHRGGVLCWLVQRRTAVVRLRGGMLCERDSIVGRLQWPRFEHFKIHLQQSIRFRRRIKYNFPHNYNTSITKWYDLYWLKYYVHTRCRYSINKLKLINMYTYIWCSSVNFFDSYSTACPGFPNHVGGPVLAL